MRWWAERCFTSLQDISRPEAYGWKSFNELNRLRRTQVAQGIYHRDLQSIPWDSTPMPPPTVGQWLAVLEEDGSIQTVFHVQEPQTLQATVYKKETTGQLIPQGRSQLLPAGAKKVRVIRSLGPKLQSSRRGITRT
jgi:hypothetical protein